MKGESHELAKSSKKLQSEPYGDIEKLQLDSLKRERGT